jgi:hypothetical protein
VRLLVAAVIASIVLVLVSRRREAVAVGDQGWREALDVDYV